MRLLAKGLICLLFTMCSYSADATDYETSTVSISPNKDKVRIDFDTTGGEFNVNRIKNSAPIVAEFNKYAKKWGIKSKIYACDTFISIPVGTRNGNISYGAFCQLGLGKKTQYVEVCYDEMEERFTIKNTVSANKFKEDLIIFTATNCFGG